MSKLFKALGALSMVTVVGLCVITWIGLIQHRSITIPNLLKKRDDEKTARLDSDSVGFHFHDSTR